MSKQPKHRRPKTRNAPAGAGDRHAPTGAGPSPSASSAAARDAMGAPIRPERGAYFLYGFHAVQAALRNDTRRIGRFWATRQATDRLADLLAARDISPRAADRATLDQLLGEGTVHQGVILEVWPLDEPSLERIIAACGPVARLVLLDQITDPHNVGAILRTAAVFGAEAVCLQARNAPPETASLAKTASGALERVPLVRIGNLSQAIGTLQEAGFWVVGLDGTARDTVRDLPGEGRLALILGAEGEGLRRLTRERCDMLVRIPMAPDAAKAAIDSLNVSNAAAIALYAALPAGSPLD
ncbi:23S rRNA (guanosine(2251)-2'-O)-methyltransferase RlmB [Marivibrio halodurans]|uniref:23S rRNA (Guanosine(2251)-2'-O)-methyltransferase RlmB n=2 Tax=Marivibrio halodurans TaxID=2039722 RepID=A0A8J7V408_9PROT|nr:23S rRNA (guanosine(2251)-2'-O)-methyltransferase RlmB [Marivibrio halodurans]